MDKRTDEWALAWTQQAAPSPTEFVVDQASLGKITKDAHSLERGVERRNVIEVLAAIAVIGLFGAQALNDEHVLVRLGNAGVALGALWICLVLYKRGRNVEPPRTIETKVFLEYYREQLTRQAKLLRSAPVWYVGPIAAGTAVTMLGRFLHAYQHGSLNEHALTLSLTLGVMLLAFAAVAAINLRGARKLETKVQVLDVLLRNGDADEV